MSSIKVSWKVGNRIAGHVGNERDFSWKIPNEMWHPQVRRDKANICLQEKQNPEYSKGIFFHIFSMELLKMLEKERGIRGWRQNRRQEQCDKTQRDYQHWITQSSPGITYVYNQALTVSFHSHHGYHWKETSPLACKNSKVLQLLQYFVDSLIVYCKTLPYSNTLSFPVNFVSSFTQLIREVFKDLDFKPLN